MPPVCHHAATPARHLRFYRSILPAPRATLFTLVILLPILLLWGCAGRDQDRLPALTTVPMDARTGQQALQDFFHAWQGVPYGNGGMTKTAVDCSGLMVLAYRDIYGIRLPRTVEDQARHGVSIPTGQLQPGDLLFFRTGLFQEHVGISLDRTRFIHASSTRGVMLSSLNEPYWQNAFRKASRLFSYAATGTRR